MRLPRWCSGETGAGTPLMLGTVLALITFGSALLLLISALGVAEKYQNISDAAALAAADSARGLIAADPCALARKIANTHGVTLHGCWQDGYLMTVSISTTIIGIPLEFFSQAGPPE